MNNAVLLSIQPKWCALIGLGKKTIEIRKTKPKFETPFKCYIYCTSIKNILGMEYLTLNAATEGKIFYWHKKVIGEFVCDSIDIQDLPYPAYQSEVSFDLLNKACLSYDYLHKYVGSGGRFYGWHISDLVIYDEPKRLSEFGLKRPPQSWCYVKEEQDEKQG